jgi:hypothetical protein
MVARSLALIMLTLTTVAGAQQPGPQMPDPQAMQMQMQQIMQQRPREAEAAARAFLMTVAPNLTSTLDSLKGTASGGQNQPIIVIDGVPQTITDRPLDQYWAEVAQLTVQFDVFQNLWRRDSVRAQLVGKMFGLEAQARAQQRAYRTALEPARPPIRSRIEALITQHFDLEDQLRALEVADIERRLADVRAETTRRRERRTEFIKWAVDDIVRDAVRPR